MHRPYWLVTKEYLYHPFINWTHPHLCPLCFFAWHNTLSTILMADLWEGKRLVEQCQILCLPAPPACIRIFYGFCTFYYLFHTVKKFLIYVMFIYKQCCFSKENRFWITQSDSKFGRRGESVSYNHARKKVPEHCSGLRPSEKQLLDWCSGASHYKNISVYKNWLYKYLGMNQIMKYSK
jgi:hypothetical protein